MVSRSAIAGLLAILAAGCSRQADAPLQANDTAAVSPDEAAPVSAALKTGTVDRSHKGEGMPAATMTDLDGKAFAPARGKPLLVNLWATWCAPCVAELPALDTAVATVSAIALNQGEEASKVRTFLDARKLTHLRPVLDPGMAVSLALSANLPTTILYDAAGKEVWRVTGARDWTSAESKALIAEAA